MPGRPQGPQAGPDADAYLRLFDRWDAAAGAGQPRWRDFGDVYQAAEDERYRLLFEQVCHLLVQYSAFNQAMPQEFRVTARQWLAGDAATLAHMGEVQHRHFMLSDLHDYVHLSRATGAGWR